MLKYDKSPYARCLIFDLDGTLANTMPYHYQAWEQAVEDFGMSLTRDFMKNHMGSSALVIARILIDQHKKKEQVTPKELVDVKHDYFQRLFEKIKPINEVFDIAKKYYGKIPMAIGTGGSRSSVNLTLKQTGIGEYFNVLVTAEDVENHKPSPDTFLLCANKLGMDPKYCEVFEDGDLGLQAAEKAGMIATDVRSWYDPTW